MYENKKKERKNSKVKQLKKAAGKCGTSDGKRLGFAVVWDLLPGLF